MKKICQPSYSNFFIMALLSFEALSIVLFIKRVYQRFFFFSQLGKVLYLLKIKLSRKGSQGINVFSDLNYQGFSYSCLNDRLFLERI